MSLIILIFQWYAVKLENQKLFRKSRLKSAIYILKITEPINWFLQKIMHSYIYMKGCPLFRKGRLSFRNMENTFFGFWPNSQHICPTSPKCSRLAEGENLISYWYWKRSVFQFSIIGPHFKLRCTLSVSQGSVSCFRLECREAKFRKYERKVCKSYRFSCKTFPSFWK